MKSIKERAKLASEDYACDDGYIDDGGLNAEHQGLGYSMERRLGLIRS